MDENNFGSYIANSKVYSDYIILKHKILLIPVPIIKIAMEEDLKIFEIGFQDKHKDFSGYIQLNEKSLYINENMSLENKRFTIAKHLGHYLMHKDQIKNLSKNENYYNDIQDSQMITEANIFAANILVPTITLKLKLSKYKSIEYPQKAIAKEFQVTENTIYLKLSILNDLSKINKIKKSKKFLKIKTTKHKADNNIYLHNTDKIKESIAIDLEKYEIEKKEQIKKIFEDLE
ncbi:ImmA/IrrE family metallo-endopeptidase (plasmid) [Borreliella yangtzensis]|uniref:Zn-dependent peptidase ImmA (M78 family) n=1 Tax=Borreliella yangtzensis TaxID=683292 RepID=A0ABR6PAS2_9SPIR|nr:ImmA/IrrE family metallo-endopeptidase [Borreliella yangtzensis]MBB6043379.1 Zn-dependent peptidase ImmA (M78 family) [Borreliella yangtzensis]WKC72905.1 ImmA/IrrE family metallo-endopeptidase [Borreliella yangtzensis]WKC73823.1 ImmA/IrrE family metallo-endopeptidase [Borreliella yangtzensis]